MKKEIIERILKLGTKVNYTRANKNDNYHALQLLKESCNMANMWQENFCKPTVLYLNTFFVEKLSFNTEQGCLRYVWNEKEFIIEE